MTKKIYEYGSWNTLSSKILNGDKSYFIHIPQVLILNERYKEAVLPWCYLLFKRGMDNTIMCSLSYLTEQCGYAYSHKKNTDAGNMAERIKLLIDLDFISVDERFFEKPNQFFEITVNYKYYLKEMEKEKDLLFKAKGSKNRNEYFAILYKDEFYRLSSYKADTKNKFDLNNCLNLYLFLKSKIPKRSNEVRESETMTLEEKQMNIPEAYNSHYKNMVDELGICNKTISKFISILVELNLIHIEVLPRKKFLYNGNYIWRTDTTIFTLTDKREKAKNNIYLLAEGSDYYNAEIERKKEKLNSLKGGE